VAQPAPERLREIPLFSELSDDALQSLAGIVTEVEVPAQQVLTRPYDPGLGMFVIEEGKVVVELGDRALELGPGEFFGELSSPACSNRSRPSPWRCCPSSPGGSRTRSALISCE